MVLIRLACPEVGFRKLQAATVNITNTKRTSHNSSVSTCCPTNYFYCRISSLVYNGENKFMVTPFNFLCHIHAFSQHILTKPDGRTWWTMGRSTDRQHHCLSIELIIRIHQDIHLYYCNEWIFSSRMIEINFFCFSKLLITVLNEFCASHINSNIKSNHYEFFHDIFPR